MRFRMEFRRYRLPLSVSVRTAHGVWTEREGAFVRLEDERAAVGFGEAAPIPWFGTETIDEVAAVAATLGAEVDETELAGVPARLGCLRSAIAEARAEIARRAETGEAAERGETGRDRAEAPAYLQVAGLVPAGRGALAEIARKAEAGFRVFKWKVGVGDVADELALLDDVCAALPDGAKLRLDANGAWERRQAERWLERCAERPVEFVEQPVFAGAAAGAAERRRVDDVLRGLASDYPVKLALDESLVGDGDVARWRETGWTGVWVVKPALLGDAETALDGLERAGADVVFSSALETAVGARAALRRALAWGGGRRAIGFGVWPLFADRRFDGPAAAPFVRREDVERIDAEARWNALS